MKFQKDIIYSASIIIKYLRIIKSILQNVKINRGKPHQNGIERPEGGALADIQVETPISGGTINSRPQQKNHQEERITSNEAAAGKDAHCIFFKELTNSVPQPMRNHHHLELSLFSNGLSSK